MKKFLGENTKVEDFLECLDVDSYNDFNLIFGTKDKLLYFSSLTGKKVELQPGLYAMSNHLLDTPWPKVTKAKRAFHEIVSSPNEIVQTREILEILRNKELSPDSLLPETGIGLDWERRLSSVFVESETYGTRSSTVITVAKDGRVHFVEQSYGPEAPSPSIVEYNFLLKY